MPASFDCKIYPLAPKEQEALEEFLKEYQKKKYIKPSKSPYASPFIFVKESYGWFKITDNSMNGLSQITIPYPSLKTSYLT